LRWQWHRLRASSCSAPAPRRSPRLCPRQRRRAPPRPPAPRPPAHRPPAHLLVDGKGRTLYLFTKDTQGGNASACTGQCLVAWPPLYGKPTAGKGADDSRLGSFALPDGTLQATYNGWPLYYWKDDAKPGDTTGQKVGGVWFVLDRDGDAVGK